MQHVADLVRHGATRAEIAADFDISAEQIDAALVYSEFN